MLALFGIRAEPWSYFHFHFHPFSPPLTLLVPMFFLYTLLLLLFVMNSVSQLIVHPPRHCYLREHNITSTIPIFTIFCFIFIVSTYTPVMFSRFTTNCSSSQSSKAAMTTTIQASSIINNKNRMAAWGSRGPPLCGWCRQKLQPL